MDGLRGVGEACGGNEVTRGQRWLKGEAWSYQLTLCREAS